MSWRSANRALYRLACSLRAGSRRRLAAPPAAAAGHGILYLCWGRLGDAVLGLPLLDDLRAWAGGRLVVVGREETAAIVAGRADRFVSLDDAATLDPAEPFAAAIADLHLFHGGLPRLGPLLARSPAVQRLCYEGYAGRDRLQPCRPFPRGVTVLPALAKPGRGADPDVQHLGNDLDHYRAALARTLGQPCPAPSCRPRLTPPADGTAIREGLELPADGYWAVQPTTSKAKKDYPIAAWQQILAAFPERRFVLLGGPAERSRNRRLQGSGVFDRTGATDVRQALAVLAGAEGFVGPDSGLAHAALALDVPTVCVAQNANLGTFFPYPSRWGAGHLRAVHHPDYRACAGCFSLCEHEPLWRTYRRGALCLRTLPAELVIESLRRPPPRPGRVTPAAAAAGQA